MKILAAAFAGLLFAFGLVLSGMTDPQKVQSFLDFGGIASGRWDPSLAFVMGGALLVTLPGFAWLRARGRSIERLGTKRTPLFDAQFDEPIAKAINAPLILGSALFGVGWGLSGYCPGPAIALGVSGGSSLLVFLVTLGLGMVLAKRIRAL
jgi:uncharacterized protein